MFKIYRSIIFFYLNILYLYYRLMKKGPFGKKEAVFIDSMEISNNNPLKNSLIRNQVKQFNEASCSVASIASVLNGVRDIENNKDFRPFLQKEILENVKKGHWKERMSKNGHNGRRGLPLSILYEVVKSSFETYGLEFKEITVVPFDKRDKKDGKLKKELKSALTDLENGKALIIAHFNQGLYLKTLQIPHISPVGGYNPENEMVTILDVDFSVEKNYQIDFQTFYNGLSSNYNNLFASHGYRSGGYVLIRF